MPAEVRNSIYDLLHHDRLAQPRSLIKNGIALLTVSKQLHYESASHFYQNTIIEVEAATPSTDTATRLPPIADRYLRFLRRLSVYTTTGGAKSLDTQKAARTIASLTTIGADLDQLHIQIRSPLSRLLNSRVDDAVLDTSHPITVALTQLLDSKAAKIIFVEMQNAWFAPGIAQRLASRYASRLRFSNANNTAINPRAVERFLTGSYASNHLNVLGLDDQDIADARSLKTPSPSNSLRSLSSSVSSAFADLDAFSVSSYQPSSNDYDHMADVESMDDSKVDEGSFFSGADIEEWEASTEGGEQEDFGDLEDMDLEDEEMEDVPQEDFDAIMGYMDDCAHHVANEADVWYLTNFAPDLLLGHHKLGHLM